MVRFSLQIHIHKHITNFIHFQVETHSAQIELLYLPLALRILEIFRKKAESEFLVVCAENALNSFSDQLDSRITHYFFVDEKPLQVLREICEFFLHCHDFLGLVVSRVFVQILEVENHQIHCSLLVNLLDSIAELLVQREAQILLGRKPAQDVVCLHGNDGNDIAPGPQSTQQEKSQNLHDNQKPVFLSRQFILKNTLIMNKSKSFEQENPNDLSQLADELNTSKRMQEFPQDQIVEKDLSPDQPTLQEMDGKAKTLSQKSVQSQTSLSKEGHNNSLKEFLIWFFVIFIAVGFIIALAYFITKQKYDGEEKPVVDSPVPDQKNTKENVYVPQYLNENNTFYQFQHRGMKVLLINPNNQSNKSQLAASVGVGSSSDQYFIGFTHFIEHMLFEGSKKFKDGEGLNEVINKYHGDRNGVTMAYNTSYFFELETEGLIELIDRVSDALTNASFNIENIEKEINNVNSEISMRMTHNKALDYYKFVKMLGNKESVMFNDGFGTIELKKEQFEETRNKVLEFYNKYYVGNLMTLTLISSIPFEVLEDKIIKSFADLKEDSLIERPHTHKMEKKVEPYFQDIKGSFFKLTSTQTNPSLTMFFTIPSEEDGNKFSPTFLFESLIHQDKKDSFITQMKNDKLITGISLEQILNDYDFSIFGVSFELAIGEAKIEDQINTIMNRFHNYVQLMSDIKPIEEYYNYIQQFSRQNFFVDQENPIFYVPGGVDSEMFDRNLDFSILLLDYSPQQLFTINKVLPSFDETLWKEFLNKLKYDNAIYLIESMEFKGVENSEIQSIDETNIIEKLREKKGVSNSSEKETPERQLGSEEVPSESDGGEKTFKSAFSKFLSQELKYKPQFDEEKVFDFQTFNMNEYKELQSKDQKISLSLDEKLPTLSTKFDVITQDCQELFPNEYVIQKQKSSTDSKESASSSADNLVTVDMEKLTQDFLETKNSENFLQDERQIKFKELKKCLQKEFEKDQQNLRPEKIEGAFPDSLEVFHKLYRKSFQNKVAVLMQVQNDYFNSELFNPDRNSQIKSLIVMDIFCDYYDKLHKYHYYQEYMKGNSGSCIRASNKFKFHFHLQKDDFDNEIIKFFDFFKDLERLIKEEVEMLSLFKAEYLSGIQGYNDYNALKKSHYLMNDLIDRFSIRNIKPEDFENIKQIVDSLSIEDITNLIDKQLNYSVIKLVFIGDISKPEVKDISQQLLKSYFGNLSISNKTETFEDYQKMVIVPTESTKVFRVENPQKQDTNNVFMAYFYIGNLQKKEEKIALSVLQYFLREWIYKELREKRNLGYVAQSFTDCQYFNYGIMILLNGERFEPQNIEEVIFSTISQFLENFKTLNPQDLIDNAKSQWDESIKVEGLLRDVSHKLFGFWSEDQIFTDKIEYKEALESYKPEDSISLAQKYLIENKRSLILEMNSGELTPEKARFILDKSLTLNSNGYELSDMQTYSMENKQSN